MLRLQELDELQRLAEANGVLAKVVYHKLADPDHKKLRTHVVDGVLKHVNNGYCSLLEPKQISGSQFAEWITGRNPGTYVAVHYLKLIDFTFGPAWQAGRESLRTGQRGLVGPAAGPTWDSVQLQVVYAHPDGREAAFDIHTSWVTPDNFPGYVEQEVQFRFDNGVWNGHQRKRGVEVTVEGRTPAELKNNPEPSLQRHVPRTVGRTFAPRLRHRDSAPLLRGSRVRRVRRPCREPLATLLAARSLTYNDLAADRHCVAIVQAMEAILARHAAGEPGATAEVNGLEGGLVLLPRRGRPEVLYAGTV